MKTLRCKIVATKPLLMHNPAVMKSPDDGGGRKRIPSPGDEARASRYVIKGDELGIPHTALRACLLSGAKGYRVGKVALGPIMSGCVSITPEDGMAALTRKGKPIKDYEVDVRRAVVQRQGVLRSRARVELPWEAEFEIQWDDEILGEGFPNTLREIIAKAGTTVGLLDYRPEKKGWFGKFELESLV